MTSEKVEIIMPDEKEKTKEKTKNPKRVSAGKRIAEAKKIKAELKRKENEEIKKENIKLKSITKDDDDDEVKKVKEFPSLNINKNYIPLCLIGVAGLGIYIYKSKQVKPIIKQQTVIQHQPVLQKKEIESKENSIGSW